MPTYIARVDYVGNGVTTDFPYAFPVLDPAFVKATVGGVARSVTVVSAGLARITPAPANGSAVSIYRESGNPGDYLVDYANGAELSGDALDIGYRHALHRSEEARDRAEGLVGVAVDAAVAQATLVSRAVPPVAPEDAGKFLRAYGTVYAWDDLMARVVDVGGDTMTGALTLPASNPSSVNHAAHKGYVDTKLPLDGSTPMTGNLTVSKVTPAILVDAITPGAARLDFQRSGVTRWRIQQWIEDDPTLLVSCHDATGALVTNVISINSATHQVSIAGTSPVVLPAVDPSTADHAVRKSYVDARTFPSGTRMVFQQSAAPPGWTKNTTPSDNNRALRIVTGSVGWGGGMGFTTAFSASRGLSGYVQGTTLTVDQIPYHAHYVQDRINSSGSGALEPNVNGSNNGGSDITRETSWAGGGQAHGHGLVLDPMQLDVAYLDVIIAQKD